MPICALIAQAVMVMPDCSLVVTIFSRQSWPLQRRATRVTSMVTFMDEECPVRLTHAGFMPARLHAYLREFTGVFPISPGTGDIRAGEDEASPEGRTLDAR